MVTKKLRDAYLRFRARRADGPWGVYSPSTALALARAFTTKTPLPGFTEDNSVSSYLPAYTRTTRGWEIRVEAVDDPEGVGMSVIHRKGSTEHEGYGTWTEEARAPYHPRDGISVEKADRRGYADSPRFRIFKGGKDYGHGWADLFDYARASGMGRGPAYDATRAEVARLAKRSDDLLSGRGDVGIVTIRAVVSRAGVELGFASVWGYEWSCADREMFARVYFPEAARDIVAEAMAEAVKTRREICGRR